jgi:hypothetical protein
LPNLRIAIESTGSEYKEFLSCVEFAVVVVVSGVLRCPQDEPEDAEEEVEHEDFSVPVRSKSGDVLLLVFMVENVSNCCVR